MSARLFGLARSFRGSPPQRAPLLPPIAVEPALAGQRLDAFLRQKLPELGQHAARRLCKTSCVRVNGSLTKPLRLLREGDLVELQTPAETRFELPVVHECASFGIVLKPPGMHSQHIAGSFAPSVERCLEATFPIRAACLLNRLDRETSGLLYCAFDLEGEELFDHAPRLSSSSSSTSSSTSSSSSPPPIRKRYVTVVDGRVAAPRSVETDGRRTLVMPLIPLLASATLVGCEITQGFRHQIREHCWRLGHPLFGDLRSAHRGQETPLALDPGARTLISGRFEKPPFLLHHGALSLGERVFREPPPWVLDAASAAVVDRFLSFSV